LDFYFWDGGTRRSKRIGNVQQFPTKAAAWRAAKPLRDAVESQTQTNIGKLLTVNALIDSYRVEKMPKREDTRRAYEMWLKNHITPKWGDCALSAVQARPVELWLTSLPLSPKSKSHIRGLLSTLWDYAMWRGEVPTERNPIELVTVKGASKRTRHPRSLTVVESSNLRPTLLSRSGRLLSSVSALDSAFLKPWRFGGAMSIGFRAGSR
jgi:integrase